MKTPFCSSLLQFAFAVCYVFFGFYEMPLAQSATPCTPGLLITAAVPDTMNCAGCHYVNTYTTCSSPYVQDTAYPIGVTQLPINFNYSHADTNPGNDSCSAYTGTQNCAGPATTYTNNSLPALSGACTLTPAYSLPASLNCLWIDYTCNNHCTTTYDFPCGNSVAAVYSTCPTP